tara:strand:- start:50 stop:358 length:309 start_codon:yes stop_codon:yes gene_type:complete
MSLIIKSVIKSKSGFQVSNAYARVSVSDRFEGTALNTMINTYVSKSEYEAGAQPLGLDLELTANIVNSYDRNSMSSDILDVAHDNMIAYLASINIEAVKDLS